MEITSKAETFLATVDDQNRVVIDKEIRKKLKIVPKDQVKIWIIRSE